MAFEALYREHFASIWRGVQRFGVAERDAADATQEVFLIAYRSYDKFEGQARKPQLEQLNELSLVRKSGLLWLAFEQALTAQYFQSIAGRTQARGGYTERDAEHGR